MTRRQQQTSIGLRARSINARFGARTGNAENRVSVLGEAIPLHRASRAGKVIGIDGNLVFIPVQAASSQRPDPQRSPQEHAQH